ncbi:MAG: FliI/YscN family ATPase [Proteobacteria bacterium]|nr:FliI/YscN family ATPase [Pseudomonadota bacterium]
MPLLCEDWRERLRSLDPVAVEGRIDAVVGLGLRAVMPEIRVGALVRVRRRAGEPLLAEVVGFQGDQALLLPFGETRGVGPDDRVELLQAPLEITFGDCLRGRVLDGLGRPIDGAGELRGVRWPVMRKPPAPLQRARIERPLALGIRAIDAFATVGEGQRVGVFAGSGVGKSTLLGQIARHADADVFVVCLVGERGRELREFLEDCLGATGAGRSVAVCATSDAPALLRVQAAYVATAVAEGFRDRGRRVVLLMDSLTRFARAAREVGLAAGEPPARRGFPPSVFAALPGLVERAGTASKGSITAFYAVLVEGGDLDEPVADEVRGIVDGHIVLSREIAARGRWPAVDVLVSLSRVMDRVVDPPHRRAAERVREHLAIYEAKRDLVLLGAYKPGSDPRLDRALERIEAIERFLRQRSDETTPYDQTRSALLELAGIEAS